MTMWARPLKRQWKNVRVGVLTRQAWTVGEWGVTRLDDTPEKCIRLYAQDEEWLVDAIQHEGGLIHYWRNRPVGYVYRGRKVYATRGILAEHTPLDAYYALRGWADWIRACGANTGSLASSGMSLWRASLHGTIVCKEPALEWPGWDAGGRVDMVVPPGKYQDIVHWDIMAAYPYSMRHMELPGRFQHYNSAPLDGSALGFARASVAGAGPGSYGPLPFREDDLAPIRYPRSWQPEDESIWTLAELRAAHERGYSVTIREAWVGIGHAVTFNQRWWDNVLRGRAMDGPSGDLAKLSSVAVWGGFICHGQGEWVEIDDEGRMDRWTEDRVVRPLCWPLAALITAQVRARLYLESLTRAPVLSCHTDGVMAFEGYNLRPSGAIPGHWRHKESIKELTLVDPAVYRYHTTDGKVRTVVSGTPDRLADRVFSLLVRRVEQPEERWIRRRRHLRARTWGPSRGTVARLFG